MTKFSGTDFKNDSFNRLLTVGKVDMSFSLSMDIFLNIEDYQQLSLKTNNYFNFIRLTLWLDFYFGLHELVLNLSL